MICGVKVIILRYTQSELQAQEVKSISWFIIPIPILVMLLLKEVIKYFKFYLDYLYL